MQQHSYPAIDMKATGRNIRSLREERGLSVEDLQDYFDFNEPRSIYKWQAGKCLPSIDNLYALSALLDVPMDSIIVGAGRRDHEPQDETCGVFLVLHGKLGKAYGGFALCGARQGLSDRPWTLSGPSLSC